MTEEKDLYQKHIETIYGSREVEDFSDDEVEDAFAVLLKILPNEGRLYKYRSFIKEKFDNYYDALKEGYLWFPPAKDLNDDFDTVLYFDPKAEAERTRDYYIKNIERYVSHSLKQIGVPYPKIRNRKVDSDYIERIVECFEKDTQKLNMQKAIALFLRWGMPIGDAQKYLLQIQSLVNGVLIRDQKMLSEETEKIMQINETIREKTFIYSMSDTYDCNPMWAFYANNNNGFCIEYNFKKACNFSVRQKRFLLSMFKVRYADDVVHFTCEDMLEYFSTGKTDKELLGKVRYDIFQCLSIKQKDWSFEREWRIMLAKLTYNKLYFDLVSRIIIDERVLKKKEKDTEAEERENAEKLIALCKEKGWGVLIRKTQYINVAHKFEELTE